MKFSTACLLSAAAVALTTPAFAQTEAPAAAPAPTAEPQPAPAAAPRIETNAAAGTKEAATAAAAAAAASRELPKVLPTTGDGATITTLLTTICQPMVNGGDLAALAKAKKIKQDRKSGLYMVKLEGKGYDVGIVPSFSNNKNVCELRVRYAIGADQPIIDALSIWSFLHQPQMVLRRNDVATYGDAERVTTTWDNWANQMIDGHMYGLALSQLNKIDGSPSQDPKFDYAVIQYTVREATRPMVDASGNAVAPGTSGAIDPNAQPAVAPAAPTADPAAAPAAPAADPAAMAPAAPTADPAAAPAAPAQ
jgi:hypothetical protein